MHWVLSVIDWENCFGGGGRESIATHHVVSKEDSGDQRKTPSKEIQVLEKFYCQARVVSVAEVGCGLGTCVQ